jgi:hypothetical protein
MPTKNSWNNAVIDANVTFNGGTVSIGTDATSGAINIGTGSAARTTTIGNTTGASKLDLKYGTADFSLASASGNTMVALDTGEITKPLQPAFLAYLASTVTNVTGNGTSYTLGTGTALTEIFDQGSNFNTNGTFTAPVTGRYFLTSAARVIGVTAATALNVVINTSNRRYETATPQRSPSSADLLDKFSTLADMDAGDTFTTLITSFGEASATDDVYGTATDPWSFMCGSLIC